MKLYEARLTAWAICDPDDQASSTGPHYAEWYEQAMTEAIAAAALDVWERVRHERPELKLVGFYLTDGGDFIAGINPQDGREYGAGVETERMQALFAAPTGGLETGDF